MQIIPVLDLKDGQVVHAVRGDRSRYQPIHFHSRLTDSSSAEAVLNGFLNMHSFRTFYIADLNAITGNGEHNQLIDSLLTRYPRIEFWVDNGSRLSDLTLNPANNYRSVIGTESQIAPHLCSDRDFILSLDFKQDQAAGDQTWFTDSSYWPQQVIIMTLNRVGGNAGPDFQKLADYSGKYPDKNFIAAGGIRHFDDLAKLQHLGIGAALIASALHVGALTGSELIKLQTKKYPGKPGYF